MKPENLRDWKARILDALIIALSALLFWLVFQNWDCLKEFLIRLFR